MNYTKGEWKIAKVTETGFETLVLGGDDGAVADTQFSWRPYTENEANAHLIAAAPDMYQALKRVLFITHNDGIGLSLVTGQEDGTNRVVFTPKQLNEIGNLLRQALNKVEGK